MGLRNPFVGPGGGNTRTRARVGGPSTRFVVSGTSVVYLTAVTPRVRNNCRTVDRVHRGYSIIMSINRASTSFRRALGNVSTNTARVARLFGTRAPLRRHGPNIMNTTLLHSIAARLVTSAFRMRGNIFRLLTHIGNSGLILVASYAHTNNVPSNRCDLNNRPVFIGNIRYLLRSNAVTNDILGLGGTIGGFHSGARLPF